MCKYYISQLGILFKLDGPSGEMKSFEGGEFFYFLFLKIKEIKFYHRKACY